MAGGVLCAGVFFVCASPLCHRIRVGRPPDGSGALEGVRVDAVDFRDEAATAAWVAAVDEPVEVAVHNIGANVRCDVADTSSRVYRKVWELAALSAFHFAKAVTPGMVARGRGTIVFTGATASTRGTSSPVPLFVDAGPVGAAGFAAFAGAMRRARVFYFRRRMGPTPAGARRAAKRHLAQSLAREVGPKGVHVAHVVVDGGVDTRFVRELLGEAAYAARVADDGLLDPDAIAEAYWALHAQPRTAWTHELDLRPWGEPF